MQAAERVREQQADEMYARATGFFHPPELLRAGGVAPPPAPNSYVSAQGSVQFYVIGQKPKDPEYSSRMDENSANILSMGGLMHNYVQWKHPKVDDKKLGIDLWEEVLNHLPDIIPLQARQVHEMFWT